MLQGNKSPIQLVLQLMNDSRSLFNIFNGDNLITEKYLLEIGYNKIDENTFAVPLHGINGKILRKSIEIQTNRILWQFDRCDFPLQTYSDAYLCFLLFSRAF